MSGWEKFGSTSYSGGSSKPIKRCYETHKPLIIGDYKVYGGSCGSPIIKDADIYVGFDYSASVMAGYPWEGGQAVVDIYFPITDGTAPKSPADFKKLIQWCANEIHAGKKLHAGCIGGHGRTGTFLAALVTELTGNLNSIEFVRTNYCKKAVESVSQVTFLHKHWGITKAKGSKEGGNYSSTGKAPGKAYPKRPGSWESTKAATSKPKPASLGSFEPSAKSKASLWNRDILPITTQIEVVK